MNSKQPILIFGAHPDDIEIGMGGTVAKLAGSGYDVKLVIATLPNFVKTDTKEARRHEAIMSAKVMGCKSPDFLDLSPDDMVFSRKFVTRIDELVPEIQTASYIYTVDRRLASRSSSAYTNGARQPLEILQIYICMKRPFLVG